MSARGRIRSFLEENVGAVVTTEQIRAVARINDYARRIRELRREEGMQIDSHRDDPSLKPGHYRLTTLDPAEERVEKPKRHQDLLQVVRAAPRDERLRAYAWLTRKFGDLTIEQLDWVL